MKYCPTCKMNIRGDRKKCPLCQANLSDSDHAEDCDCGNIFPAIPNVFEQHSFITKAAIFFSISSGFITVMINLMVPHNSLWSLFVVFGIACVLCSFIIALKKRNNIIKNMYNQVTMVSIFAILWDFLTQWRGWSIDFVIPILLCFNIGMMLGTAQITKTKIEDYIFYLTLNCAAGLVPFLFLALGIISIVYPSYICGTLSVVALTALCIFYGNKLVSEVKKRFHM